MIQQTSATEIEQLVDAVMRDERLERFRYRDVPELPSWLDRFGDWLDNLFGDWGLDSGSQTLAIVMAALLGAGLLTWMGWVLWKSRKRGAEVAAQQAEEDPAAVRERWVREQLERGLAAEQSGDWPLALRSYWAALVVGLGQSRLLAFRPGWTCREMLQRSAGSRATGTSQGASREVAALLPRVEAMEFGDRPVGPAEVGEVAGLCRNLLPERLQRARS